MIRVALLAFVLSALNLVAALFLIVILFVLGVIGVLAGKRKRRCPM